MCFIVNGDIYQLTKYSSADVSFVLLTSIELKDCDGVQSVFCGRPSPSVTVGSFVGTARWRLGSTGSFRTGVKEEDCTALFREAALLMHITARKKSSVRFIRLLLKSSVRPDPWAPPLRTSCKSSNSPHASVGTFVPVAVKSNPKRQSHYVIASSYCHKLSTIIQ